MPINLLNEKVLNDYLIELVWGHNMPSILDGKSQAKLKAISQEPNQKNIPNRDKSNEYWASFLLFVVFAYFYNLTPGLFLIKKKCVYKKGRQ